MYLDTCTKNGLNIACLQYLLVHGELNHHDMLIDMEKGAEADVANKAAQGGRGRGETSVARSSNAS